MEERTNQRGELILLCGIPGSGKSTVAELYSDMKEKTVVLSSDEMRKHITGSYSDMSQNEEVFQQLHNVTQRLLDTGVNIVYDATNTSAKRRKHLIKHVLRASKYTAVFLYRDLDKCIEADKVRDEKKVGEDVVRRMYARMEVPFKEEGFDNVIYLTANKESLKEPFLKLDSHDTLMERIMEKWEPFKKIYYMDQDNPNHSLTTSEHTFEVMRNLPMTMSMQLAGLFHDLGKAETQTYFDMKGNPKDHASYYGHENVSAQRVIDILLRSRMDHETMITVAKLVQFHMRPYLMPENSLQKKVFPILGDDLYEELWRLNKADRLAK